MISILNILFEVKNKDWYKEYLNNESLYDNPIEVVTLHPDYKKFVNKIKNTKSPTKIKSFIENWILENEDAFAAIIFQNESEDMIYCEHGAEMVSKILEDSSKSHTVMVGNVNDQSHAWVTCDNVIIDPTKDQFPNISDEDYFKDVYYKKLSKK
jgi:hypothetical protein